MKRSFTLASIAALLIVTAAPVHAASIYLSPASSAVSSGPVILELFADFTDQATVGGGIDFNFGGPVASAGFAPSSWFTTATDPGFSGYGTANADQDYEVHFGNFAGLSGLNKVGDLTLNLNGTGLVQVALAINSVYGDFYPTAGNQPIAVALSGAEVNVVPLPASMWLLGTALVIVAGRRGVKRRGPA
jgi:hypothetical protein